MDTQLQNINGKHRREIEKLENIIRANTEEAAAQLKHLEEEFNGRQRPINKNMMMEDKMENINKQHEETERHSDELRQQTKEERERNNVLQNMNAGLGNELEELKHKCEGCERDLQTSVKHSEKQTKDITGLQQKIEEFKQMLEEKEKEKESDMQDMKTYYEKRLREGHEEHEMKEIEREQELHRREREVEKRKRN